MFAAYDPNTQMSENQFGIRQPALVNATMIEPGDLDLVLTPLVAFDAACRRIGVGGGFYDRTFAFKQDAGQAVPPTMVGVAFELQKVDMIVPQAWDVPLNSVVTEQATYTR
jgi:5-formyltetrahydrofolate cyclo-ligase